MTRSKESIINFVLNHNSHLLADFGRCVYLPTGVTNRQGYAKYSKMFCDSMVFWGICNTANEKSKGKTIGKYIAELREVFGRTSLTCDSIKTVSSGVLRGDDYFSAEMQAAYAEEIGDDTFTAGYIAVKVSLHHSRAKNLVIAMASILPHLSTRHIVLHDLDMTHDCRYISTRYYVEQHLRANGITGIINDRQRVGDHCISWMGQTASTKDIRYKVYNKFVQMLESAEVRKSLGSRMEDLVANGDHRFNTRLMRHKDHGLTRVELTFYGPRLKSLMDYRDEMDATRDLLSGCRTFICSYEQQWIQRAQLIKSMVAVYVPSHKIFAYCHWWNSVTSKKYGYMWNKVSAGLAMHLVANYAFNDRPIYYVEAKVSDDNSVEITKTTIYEREPGCKARTLVAGGAKGMYPSRGNYPGDIPKFSDVGIVPVDNIRIGWPKGRHNKDSAPLAVLVQRNGSDHDDRFVKTMSGVHSSTFTSGYNVLEPGREYTISAASILQYRGELYWHLITECGLRVRAGKYLERLWEKWRGQYRDDAGIVLRDSIPKMTFVTVRKVRSKGTFDMKCRLVGR